MAKENNPPQDNLPKANKPITYAFDMKTKKLVNDIREILVDPTASSKKEQNKKNSPKPS